MTFERRAGRAARWSLFSVHDMALRLMDEDALLRELGENRRRFQSRMRQLVEKVRRARWPGGTGAS